MRAVDSTNHRPRGEADAEPVELDNDTAADDVAIQADAEQSEPVSDSSVAQAGPPPDDLTEPAPDELTEPAPEERIEPTSEDRIEPTPEDVSEPTPQDRMEPTSDDRIEPAPEHRIEPSSEVERGPSADGLWPEQDAEGLRQRWREVQLRFVDDPRAAADEAASIVDDARQALVTAIDARCRELGQWQQAGIEEQGETEQLRVVVRRYRDFLDRVLGV
jgi:hypothetical protein